MRRLEPAGATGTRYDLFDRTGNRVGVMRLGTDQRLLAVSARHRFVIRTDADSLQWIERHAIP